MSKTLFESNLATWVDSHKTVPFYSIILLLRICPEDFPGTEELYAQSRAKHPSVSTLQQTTRNLPLEQQRTGLEDDVLTW